VTLHVHLERIVVDGPLPTSTRQWRAALAEAVARELRAGAAGEQAPPGGLRLAALPPATLPPGSTRTAGPLGAAVGRAVRAGIGGGR
jgi:hypothetical protein